MLRINRMTDYGVVILSHLARQPGVHAAQDIAEATGVPLPSAAKILKDLARAGLIQAQRGARGGYRLAQHPAAISVAAIIEALEGPIALTACVEGAVETCTLAEVCSTRGHWSRVNTAVRVALDAVTLAEMAAPPIRTAPAALAAQ